MLVSKDPTVPEGIWASGKPDPHLFSTGASTEKQVLVALVS